MKTIRQRKGSETLAAFKNRFVTYGKAPSGKYVIEISFSASLFRGDHIPIYVGKKKPLFRNIFIMALLSLPLFVPWCITVLFAYVLAMYINGCRNFLKNGVDITHIRFFSWVNIAVIGLLTAILIINL